MFPFTPHTTLRPKIKRAVSYLTINWQTDNNKKMLGCDILWQSCQYLRFFKMSFDLGGL